MGQIERVLVVIVCAGCLVVPLALMLGGALEPEEVEVLGDGTVVYTRNGPDLKVKFKGQGRLPVGHTAAGKPVTETSANDIPTQVNVERAHADAFEMPVQSRRDRGLRPQAPAAGE